MLIQSEKCNINYLAKIIKIENISKHPSADRLQIVMVDGNTVITGLDAKLGDIYVYFPLECAINLEYLSWSNSFQDKTLNEDKTKAGFFIAKGRVKATKLRGIPSQGYIVPISNFNDWLSIKTKESVCIDETAIGSEFDYFNNIKINEKYVNIQTIIDANKAKSNKAQNRVKNQSRLVPNQVRLHIDTPKLGSNMHQISPNDLISITAKLHGTSGTVQKVLVKKDLTFFEKILKKIGFNIVDTEYDLIYTSRKVVKNSTYNDEKVTSGYYKEDIWKTVASEFKEHLIEGQSIYFEIVGFMKSGQPIQKDYDYGCSPTEHKVYIYRITHTNPSGHVIELSAKQVQQWCFDHGVLAVPELYYGYAADLYPELKVTEHWQEEFLNKIQKQYLEKDDPLCINKVPDEGIVLRKETLDIDVFKCKSFRFFEKETKDLDAGIVDIESEESVGN